MIKSVIENKGFYIGRYNTSLINNKIKAQSKSINEVDMTDITTENTWYEFYESQRNYSNSNNLTNEIGSSMILGYQYDQMYRWLNNIEKNFSINDEIWTLEAAGTSSKIVREGSLFGKRSGYTPQYYNSFSQMTIYVK